MTASRRSRTRDDKRDPDRWRDPNDNEPAMSEYLSTTEEHQ